MKNVKTLWKLINENWQFFLELCSNIGFNIYFALMALVIFVFVGLEIVITLGYSMISYTCEFVKTLFKKV